MPIMHPIEAWRADIDALMPPDVSASLGDMVQTIMQRYHSAVDEQVKAAMAKWQPEWGEAHLVWDDKHRLIGLGPNNPIGEMQPILVPIEPIELKLFTSTD